MSDCRQCSKRLGFLENIAGICESCSAANIAKAKAISTASGQPTENDISQKAASHIGLSTETFAFGETVERLGLVSSVVIFGSHLGKDIMAAWRDALGGRAQSAETLFNDARETCLNDLKTKADAIGATEIIALQVSYQDLTGNGKNMVMVTAQGTAIRRPAFE